MFTRASLSIKNLKLPKPNAPVKGLTRAVLPKPSCQSCGPNIVELHLMVGSFLVGESPGQVRCSRTVKKERRSGASTDSGVGDPGS